jgi:GNAT superfamily N-acetyltransferase
VNGYQVVAIAATDTHALRRSVLRVGVPATDIEFAEDQWPGALHLGVRLDGGDLVAISSWIPRPAPDVVSEAGSAVQLRGMATRSDLQGAGWGGVLVEAGCERMAAAGHTLVWARARDAALRFYERHGFAVVGEGFVDANTQLPHHLVTRRL